MRFFVYAILGIFLAGGLMAFPQPISAETRPILTSTCDADTTFSTFVASNACDKNPTTASPSSGTRWVSALTGSEHWLRVNLTLFSLVEDVIIIWGNAPMQDTGGVIETWNGTAWNTHVQLHPSDTGNTANTYVLDIPTMTNSIRVRGSNAGLAEVEIREVYPEARVDCSTNPHLPSCPGSAPTNSLPSINLLALSILGGIWIFGAIAGTILRTGFFVILGGISALAFAITAWTTTGELFSSTLLFAAAVLTLAWVPFMADRERTPE